MPLYRLRYIADFFEIMYRIMQNQKGYYVQEKFLFWWRDITEFHCDILGYGGEYTIYFKSEREAEKYIDGEKKFNKLVKYV